VTPYGLPFARYTGALRNGTVRRSAKYRRATHQAQRAAVRRQPKRAERREARREIERASCE
jgi:hypothetical protein